MRSVKMTILYIFTLDFGEIINSYFFTKDQPFRVVFACPPPLFPWIYQAHVTKYQYTTREDLIRIVEETKPRLIILSSGYLFQVFNLFSLSELRKLISYVKECNIPYVTTDPWMKIWMKYSVLEIYNNTHDMLLGYHSLQKQLNDTFKNVYHLYPFPITENQCLSFFNPKTVMTKVEKNSREEQLKVFFQKTGHYDNCSDKPLPGFNMFVLSDMDFKMSFYGQKKTKINKFKSLSNRLSEIICNTSDILVIVAPNQCCEILKNQFSKQTRICFLPFCKFSLFYSLLMCAKVVLYWNVFSASILGRILNHLPVYFFSKGHMVTLCPKLYEHGVPFFYQRHPPFFIDPLSSIPANLFQEPFEVVKSTFQEISKHWRLLKTPEEIVLELIKES